MSVEVLVSSSFHQCFRSRSNTYKFRIHVDLDPQHCFPFHLRKRSFKNISVNFLAVFKVEIKKLICRLCRAVERMKLFNYVKKN